MSDIADITNEMQIVAAFNKQSAIFDDIYADNSIIQYKRKRVRIHVEKLIEPNSSILELNAGTGEDSIYFAGRGHRVHATDISHGMQAKLCAKIRTSGLEDKITQEVCSFNSLGTLSQQGPFDLIFSNFAGLNCTRELDKVLRSFKLLLKNDGIVTLVVLPKFCLWETALALKGKFKTAFRRFFSSNGRKAHIEGEYFLCWYYNPSFIKRILKDDFEVLSVEGLCSVVPPSYIENFAEKYPGVFKFFCGMEEKLKARWPWRSIGDYYIISLKRKNG
ncbi:MAG: methyltransferase domain-containing protein [Bacteroidetes bacterium]|nr:MAG: methyltransferase domain-containing protein [Bacteroidota bacterium]